MKEDKRPILVFGATGRQGGAVAEALLKARWPVRAIVRDTAAPKSVALRQAGAELVEGLFADLDTFRAGMNSVHGVFSVLPANLSEAEEVRIGCGIADLAAESGVAHLVYSSGASSGDTPTGIARFDAKPRIEAHIRRLPVTATIIRPMIFMDMLINPAFGLSEGRYKFFLRPDQSMQLIAVEDIGKFVAAIFADGIRFSGRTMKIASDTVTGRQLGEIFSEAACRPIIYSRFADEVLAANSDLGQLAAILDNGPLADHVDLAAMREINPEIISFQVWLATQGHQAFDAVIGSDHTSHSA
ncbi:NmrA/HSCARG family protein [Agrobacterium sp. Ap1]|uniref:NmrA/HSCARG family protein n=1 Tax=Agrobacterium sp. Ap1 TaxID=2815337 RepID=UPI001A8F01E6|nr:NmrA/HSCARG family protein [Agrobacterium sp. Ap1]MBO0140466.1 NmrA/HSCARG family protein [Agrobacterium sp. Ap1]